MGRPSWRGVGMLSSIPAGSDCRLGPPTVWRPRFFKFTGTPVCLLFSCFLVHLTNDSPGLSPPNEHQLQSGPPPAPQPVGAIVVCLPSSLFLLHFAYFCRRRKAPALAPGLPPALPWVGAIIVVCLPSLLLLLPFTYFCRRRKAPALERGPPLALPWVGAIINKTLHFVCCAMACFAICGTFAWMKEKFKEARVLGWLKGWFGVRRGQ
jgi:hypothetical protein